MLPQKVEAVLNTVQQLRPMPANVTRTLREMEDPEVSLALIADHIGLDQALAALVLQLSNSVSLGYERTCKSLREAVMRIGLKRLRSILLASSAVGPLFGRLSGYRLGAGELWKHSLATAFASEWLANQLGYPDPEEAYVSGLLHDIGKLLLDQFVLADYNQILSLIEKYQMPLWQVEEKLIGVDHAKVGGMMAEKWMYPVPLVDSIRCHHCPSLARSNQRLPAIIDLANAVSGPYVYQNTCLFHSDIHPETLNILRLDKDKVASLQKTIEEEVLPSVP